MPDLISKGSVGDDVRLLQTWLVQLGYDLGPYGPLGNGVDGQFGDMTKAAVESFQRANDLVADGIVGTRTWGALQTTIAGAAAPPLAAPPPPPATPAPPIIVAPAPAPAPVPAPPLPPPPPPPSGSDDTVVVVPIVIDPTPAPAPAPAPPPPLQYQIVWGDNLGSIAQRFDTSVSAILGLNPSITDPNRIQAGATILVPNGTYTAPTSSPSLTPGGRDDDEVVVWVAIDFDTRSEAADARAVVADGGFVGLDPVQAERLGITMQGVDRLTSDVAIELREIEFLTGLNSGLSLPIEDIGQTMTVAGQVVVNSAQTIGGYVMPQNTTTIARPRGTTSGGSPSGSVAVGSYTVTVRSGDTLSSIAVANGVSLAEVQAANPHLGPNFNLIHPGDVVTIPTGATGSSGAPALVVPVGSVGGGSGPAPGATMSAGTRQVTVGRGDTLSGIAAANGVTLEAVQAANPHLGPNFNVIHPGDVVTIPAGGSSASVGTPIIGVSGGASGRGGPIGGSIGSTGVGVSFAPLGLVALNIFMAAIRTKESSGNYQAVGPPTPWGRATGAYQFVQDTWNRAIRTYAPRYDDYIGVRPADVPRAVQDAVAAAWFTGLFERYGSWELVAVAHFAGEGTANRAERGADISGIRDVLGTNAAAYARDVLRLMGQAPSGTPTGSSIGGSRVGGIAQDSLITSVVVLQRALNALQFNAGDEDGLFGPDTTRAVERFQRAHDLDPDGLVGPITSDKIIGQLEVHGLLSILDGNPAPAPAPAPASGSTPVGNPSGGHPSGTTPPIVTSTVSMADLEALIAQRARQLQDVHSGSGELAIRQLEEIERQILAALASFTPSPEVVLSAIARGVSLQQALINANGSVSPGLPAVGGSPVALVPVSLEDGGPTDVIAILQTALTVLDYNTYGIDGIFGDNTHNAVVAFQRDFGLATDGLVGDNTWGAIRGALNGIGRGAILNGAAAPIGGTAPVGVSESRASSIIRELPATTRLRVLRAFFADFYNPDAAAERIARAMTDSRGLTFEQAVSEAAAADSVSLDPSSPWTPIISDAALSAFTWALNVTGNDYARAATVAHRVAYDGLTREQALYGTTDSGAPRPGEPGSATGPVPGGPAPVIGPDQQTPSGSSIIAVADLERMRDAYLTLAPNEHNYGQFGGDLTALLNEIPRGATTLGLTSTIVLMIRNMRDFYGYRANNSDLKNAIINEFVALTANVRDDWAAQNLAAYRTAAAAGENSSETALASAIAYLQQILRTDEFGNPQATSLELYGLATVSVAEAIGHLDRLKAIQQGNFIDSGGLPTPPSLYELLAMVYPGGSADRAGQTLAYLLDDEFRSFLGYLSAYVDGYGGGSDSVRFGVLERIAALTGTSGLLYLANGSNQSFTDVIATVASISGNSSYGAVQVLSRIREIVRYPAVFNLLSGAASGTEVLRLGNNVNGVIDLSALDTDPNGSHRISNDDVANFFAAMAQRNIVFDDLNTIDGINSGGELDQVLSRQDIIDHIESSGLTELLKEQLYVAIEDGLADRGGWETVLAVVQFTGLVAGVAGLAALPFSAPATLALGIAGVSLAGTELTAALVLGDDEAAAWAALGVVFSAGDIVAAARSGRTVFKAAMQGNGANVSDEVADELMRTIIRLDDLSPVRSPGDIVAEFGPAGKLDEFLAASEAVQAASLKLGAHVLDHENVLAQAVRNYNGPSPVLSVATARRADGSIATSGPVENLIGARGVILGNNGKATELLGFIRRADDVISIRDVDDYISELSRIYETATGYRLQPALESALRQYIRRDQPIRAVLRNPDNSIFHNAGLYPGSHTEFMAINRLLAENPGMRLDDIALSSKWTGSGRRIAGSDAAACPHCTGLLSSTPVTVLTGTV